MLKYKKKIISALMKKKLFCDIFSSVWQYPQIEIFGPKSHLSLEYISLWKKFVKDAYYNLLILGIWSPVGILKIHPTLPHPPTSMNTSADPHKPMYIGVCPHTPCTPIGDFCDMHKAQLVQRHTLCYDNFCYHSFTNHRQ